MRISRLKIFDYVYIHLFEKTLVFLDSEFDVENPSVIEIIEMWKAIKFYNDKHLLIGEAKRKIEDKTNVIETIKSSLGLYFRSIKPIKFLSDIDSINSNNHDDIMNYIDAMLFFADKKIFNGETIEKIIQSHDFLLGYFLSDEKIAKINSGTFKHILQVIDYGIKFYVDEFDKKKEEEYFLPKMNEVDIDLMINKYLLYEECSDEYVYLLKNHKNSIDSYSIKRHTRVEIIKWIEKFEKQFDENAKVFASYTVLIDNNQEEICLIKGNSRERLITFCGKHLKQYFDYPTILNNFIYVFSFTDYHFRIRGLYNENRENTFDKILEIKHKNGYGSDKFWQEQLFYRCKFYLYYDFLNRNHISLEDIIEWFFKDYLKVEFGIDNFNIKLYKIDDYRLMSINLADCIESVLKQYRIYVEEKKLNNYLVLATNDAVKFSDYPSLNTNKYYEKTDDNELNKILFLLFDDQSGLCYANEHLSANSLYKLLKYNSIKTSDYNYYDEDKFNYLIDKNIIKILSTDKIVFENEIVASILENLYSYGFVSYYHQSDKEKKQIELMPKKWLTPSTKLFSKEESDYLSYYLNNEKFSNAIALRNNYMHGSSFVYTDEQNKENYFTMLRLLILIVIKINDDLCIYFDNQRLI